MQSRSFLGADGVVFLTEYAQEVVLARLPHPPRQTVVIPHGVDNRFRCPRVHSGHWVSILERSRFASCTSQL